MGTGGIMQLGEGRGILRETTGICGHLGMCKFSGNSLESARITLAMSPRNFLSSENVSRRFFCRNNDLSS